MLSRSEDGLARPTAPGRVVVAMSGGVDSATAAWLLKSRGFDVVGITMRVYSGDDGSDGCCSAALADDARRVASQVGVAHYVVDVTGVFAATVIASFCREYRRGRTPNPCLVCNTRIKFGALAEQARRLEASYLATGHYARTDYSPTRRRYLLLKGADPQKDQSYALYGLTQEQLAFALFPLGPYTKDEVRALARTAGLPVADKPESQEICFVPDGDYLRLVRERAPEALRPGPIVDRRGRRLGTHRGVAAYTVGQRRGLGLTGPEPFYVLGVDAEANTVLVGTRSELLVAGLVAQDCNWIAQARIDRPVRATAKIRYRAPEVGCVLEPAGPGRVVARFDRPQLAVAPGQAAVFYQGDLVLGGGTIERPLHDPQSGREELAQIPEAGGT